MKLFRIMRPDSSKDLVAI